MGKFTPYEGMVITHPNAPYSYTVLEIDGDTLKCCWEDWLERTRGYCEMSMDYAEKIYNLSLDVLKLELSAFR